MEFYEELFLTAVISILLAFLIGKIAAGGGDEDSGGIHSASPTEAVTPVSHVALMEQKTLHPSELCRGSGGRDEKPKPAGGEKLVGELPAGSAETPADEVEVQQARSELDQAARDLGFDLVEKEHRDEETDPVVSRPQEEMNKELDNEVKIERIEADFAGEEEQPVEVERIARAAPEEVPDEGVKQFAQSERVEQEKAAHKAVGEQQEEERLGEKEGTLLHGEDEWEGIERSELEKQFRVATAYFASEKGTEAASELSNELQMQLFGLQKVAMEGPCYQPQPMALKISARAKWNAWQRLGSLTPDAAMEKFISLLTNSIPGWTEKMHGGEVNSNDGHDPPRVGLFATQTHQSTADDRVNEDTSDMQSNTDNVADGPNLLKRGPTNTFLLNLLSPARVAFLILFVS